MPKLPFLKWFTSDWLTQTRNLSLAAKGFFADLLNYLWISDTRGALLNHTPLQLSRMMGCTVEEGRAMLTELEAQGLVTVTVVRPGLVDITSRRMLREAGALEHNAERQARFRQKETPGSNAPRNGGVTPSVTPESRGSNGSGNAPVTAQKTEGRSQIDDDKNHHHHPRARAPSRDAVVAYAVSRGLAGGDGEYFFNECEKTGWESEGKPIRSWQRWFATWQAKGTLPSQQPAPPPELESGTYIGGVKVA